MRRWPTSPEREESGAALVAALVFMVVVGLLVGALLALTAGGLKASTAYATASQDRAAAAGAVDAAINQVAGGMPCPGDWTAPVIGGSQFIVRCAGADDPSHGPDGPALQAVGTTDDDGISVSGSGLAIQGDVFANAAVTADSGAALSASGAVSSPKDCAAAVTLADSITCADQAPAGPVLRAPERALPTSVLPPPQSVPDCPASGGWLVRLKPGYYDAVDAAALQALTNGACPGVVVWIEPGVHYFDLNFGNPAATGVWTVDDPSVHVVGGTPRGWDPEAATAPEIPGQRACDPDQPGTHLLLGGGTRLRFDRGAAEFCGVSGGPAIQGVAPDHTTHTLEPSRVMTYKRFANVRNGLRLDEYPGPQVATAPIPAGGRATFQVGGFDASVPSSAALSDVQLVVAHREAGVGADVTVQVSFDGFDAGAPGCPLDGSGRAPIAASPTAVTDVIDLSACGLTDPEQLVGFAPTVIVGAGASPVKDYLDGVALRARYRAPATFQPAAVTSPATAGDTAFATPDKSRLIDGSVAHADLTGTERASAVLRGLVQPAIPSGAQVTGVSLVVSHVETGDMDDPVVSVATGDGSSACGSVPLDKRATLGKARVDLAACGLTDPAQLNNLSLTYSAAASGGSGTADLDGVWLQVQFLQPTGDLLGTTATSTATAAIEAFADPDAALIPDEQPSPLVATASLPVGARTRAELTVGGFDTSAVPREAQLGTAQLSVTHREQPTGPDSTVVPAVTVVGPNVPEPCTLDLPVRSTALTTDTVNLITACGLADPRQLDGLEATFSLRVADDSTPNVSGQLDAIALEVDQAPALADEPQDVTSPAAGAASDREFSSATHALGIDGSVATATLPQDSDTQASIQLGGFPTAVTDGARLLGVTLDIAHLEGSTALTPAIELAGPGYAGPCADAPYEIPRKTTSLATSTIDLAAACDLDSASQLAGLKVIFVASVADSGVSPATVDLDGIVLHATWEPTVTATASEATSSDYDHPAWAAAIGEQPASARVAEATVAPDAAIELSGFTAPADGSRVEQVRLRVRHEEVDDAAAPVAHIAFPSSSCPDIPLTRHVGALHSDTVLLAGGCKPTTAAEFAGLTVTIDTGLTSGGTSGTSRLDGAVLDVTLDVPRIEALYGCAVRVGPGSCAVITATDATAGTSRFIVHGALYAPTAAVSLEQHDLDGPVVAGALTARAIRLDLTRAASFHASYFTASPTGDVTTFVAHPFKVVVPTAASSADFASPNNALAADEQAAEVTFSGALPTASLALTGWSGTAPASGLVVLRLAHQEDGAVTGLTIHLHLPADGPHPVLDCDLAVPVHRNAATFVTDQFDLTSPTADQPCGVPAGRDLSSLEVSVTATGATASSVGIDAAQLDLLEDPRITATVVVSGSQTLVTRWETPE